jgi:hypothetical protein
VYTVTYRGFESLSLRQAMVVGVGPLALLGCEPRQVWKEAAVIIDASAEVWLVQAASNIFL